MEMQAWEGKDKDTDVNKVSGKRKKTREGQICFRYIEKANEKREACG